MGGTVSPAFAYVVVAEDSAAVDSSSSMSAAADYNISFVKSASLLCSQKHQNTELQLTEIKIHK